MHGAYTPSRISQCSIIKGSLQEHKCCWWATTVTCLSPVTSHPYLIMTLEINEGLVHERSDSSCGDHSLFFFPFPGHTLARPYLNLTMTHALVLFMDMPNLTFTMVIQGDTLRWLRFRWKPVFVAVEESRSHRFHGQAFSIWCQVVLHAYVAHSKNGSSVPEEPPGVCSSLNSSCYCSS